MSGGAGQVGALRGGEQVEAEHVSRDWLRLVPAHPASPPRWVWLLKPPALPGPPRQM